MKNRLNAFLALFFMVLIIIPLAFCMIIDTIVHVAKEIYNNVIYLKDKYVVEWFRLFKICFRVIKTGKRIGDD